MHCLSCKSEDLSCEVVIVKFIPFAKKGGNINVAGHAVSQKDIVDAWLKETDGTERAVLEPIICLECGQEHSYHKGETVTLRKKATLVAVAISEDETPEGETPPEEDVEG